MRLRRRWSVSPQRLLFVGLLIAGLVLVLWAVRSSCDRLRVVPVGSPNLRAVMDSAMEQTHVTISYDPSYACIPYPGGDVPSYKGVCSDVVVRAFRKAGVDLQVKVHEDMERNFSAYPHQWGLKRPDPNIDHRRVPNLMTFFRRQGKEVPISLNSADYRPGDVVVWDFGAGKVHTGLVSNRQDPKTGRFWIVHNAGMGTRLQDRLFKWPIIGHYRYFR